MATQTKTVTTVDIYMKQANRYPILSREEEQELAKAYRDGDEAAGERLVNCNLRFVVKVAHEYTRYGARLSDLIQEGNLGLLIAVGKFDPDRKLRLISYAVWWIRAYMQNYVLRNWSVVRIGTTQAQRKLFYRVRGQWERMQVESEHTATIEDLAADLGMKTKVVSNMLQRMSARDLSLETPLGTEDGSATHGDMVPDKGPVPETIVADDQRLDQIKLRVHDVLAALDQRERYIIEQRLMTDKPKTLAEVGSAFGISREWARKLELRAKDKLRKMLPDGMDLLSPVT